MGAEANGDYLHYIARGEGRPVILIHGMAASLYDWEALVPELASAGYRAFAMDLYGHGESYKPDDPQAYTLDSIYTTLELWIERLKERPPFFLVGHSLGGYLCMKYALRHPEKVRGLALIAPLYNVNQVSPLLRWLNHRPSWAAKAIQFVPLTVIDTLMGWDPINAVQFSAEARWQIAVDYKRASPHVLNILPTIPDLTPELDKLEVPSQIIWGENDLTLNPRSFPKLLSALPRATGASIRGSGHQPHIGKPQRVNRLILDFMCQYPE